MADKSTKKMPLSEGVRHKDNVNLKHLKSNSTAAVSWHLCILFFPSIDKIKGEIFNYPAESMCSLFQDFSLLGVFPSKEFFLQDLGHDKKL